MIGRFKMIASGYVLFTRDGSILLSRRFQTGYEDGKYSLPAGHIEEHETLTLGTCREMKEEIGITLLPRDLDLVHIMHRRQQDERMDFFFIPKHWHGEPNNREPQKCDELRWVPLNKLPLNTIPYIAEAIRKYQKHILYSEFGWDL